MRRVIAALGMLMLTTPLWGQEPAREEPVEHRVQRGETLWELARRYLDDPYQWRVIYHANSARLSDPDLILPGQVLHIPTGAGPAATGRVSIRPGVQEPDPLGDPVAPTRSGQPQPAAQAAEEARAARPAQPATEETRPTGLAFDRAAPRAAPQDPDRTVFHRPPSASRASDRPTVLSEPAIDHYPVKPGEFSSAAWVASPAEMEVLGTFIRSVRTDPDAWGGPVWSHPNDQVLIAYADGVRPEPGTRLVLVQVGDRIRTGGQGDRIIDPRGIARVTSLNADAIEARIETQYGPIMPGQLAVPEVAMPEQSASEAGPVPDGYDLEGRLVAFAIERPIHNRADLAFVDLGRAEGVRLGDVFLAFIPSRESDVEAVPDRTLPPEPVAELRVVRVTENTATVKVDRIMLPRLREDLPVRRIRRMP